MPAFGWLRVHTELIGFCAGTLTTVAFAPQVIHAWRRGSHGLSWAMLALFGSGVGLWFVYGLMRASRPIIAANGLTGLQVLVLLALKLRNTGASQGR